ncbi:hypothetical protein C1H46_021639 [Malus baccata]|uniref:Uncharacterized protein n=1 Tax=Malus baccata TaxID=106549 RepID=A0A540M204_MALBA|nr:hypothetical protein C1H46_021639 [Malus baccata]
MVFASKTSKLHKVSPYNLPLTRVYSRKEGQAFVESHLDILNQYLLNEILDLEAKREGKCSSSDDPVSNVPTDPSTSAREKGVGKID